MPNVSDEIKSHFQQHYPILLDGTLTQHKNPSHLEQQARETLFRGKTDPNQLPAAILRETLETVIGTPAASTQAGLIPINPKTARIWWDKSILENLDDVLAHLDTPKAVLRFYDVTDLDPEGGRWNDSFDIDIELDEHGRTISLWSADRTYVVDLGYVHADGRFLKLARTNAIHLPREGAGDADPDAVNRASLRPHQQVDRNIVPDAAARDWAAARKDAPERDVEAELLIHMLYRAFLREGPRALRRSPRLARRDELVLQREYAQRERQRERARKPLKKVAAPAFLVARLDTRRAAATPVRVRYQVVPAAVATGMTALNVLQGVANAESFVWHRGLLAAVRAGKRVAAAKLAFERQVEPAAELVREAIGEHVSMSLLANPVFEAAQSLRNGLSRMTPVVSDIVDDMDDAVVTEAETETDTEATGEYDGGDPLRVFGGAEAKRMAKAGVRITRMALTLEGRMRPGARLKVAGKLVHADADGCFRLECVLSGRRASIPMRAGTSIGGEARSLINVDWEKRASREKKKVFQ